MACLSDINCWTSKSFLKLNDEITEIFAKPNSFSQIALSHNIKPTVRNLGVLFDSGLCFDDQLKNMVQSYFFNLS